MTDIGPFRIVDHPILGADAPSSIVRAVVDGREIGGREGEPISATLIAHGILSCRTTPGSNAYRGYFCGSGRCGDCVMTVDGELNVRTCVTPLRAGMVIETQSGLGTWRDIA